MSVLKTPDTEKMDLDHITKVVAESTTPLYDTNTLDAAINKRMEELGLNNVPTDTEANAPPASTNTSYSRGSYVASDLVNQAQAALQTHLNNAPGAYQSQWQTQINDILNAYRNREDFQYDLDSDALYQQYADQYALKGQLAMMDTMGQAAAMTGGYGNSYAATAGNQAYQSYLQQLNDVIPELYGMAYDRYKQEGEDMLTEYSLLSDRESADYEKYQNDLNRYYTDLDYLANRYDSERAYDYSVYQDQLAYEDSKKAVINNTVYDKNGNPITVDDKTGVTPAAIPDEYKAKAATFTNNDALANWAYGLADSGSITEEQADQLIAAYMDHNEKYDTKADGSRTISYSSMVKSTSGWSVADDGGVNWLWGVDNNARVEAPNGEIIRLDNLVDKLVAEGMKKSDAKSYVKKLQKNLGI